MVDIHKNNTRLYEKHSEVINRKKQPFIINRGIQSLLVRNILTLFYDRMWI